MGEVKKTNPVKLFIGMLSSKIPLLDESCKILSEKWGDIDCQTPNWDFTFTNYYESEMGSNLFRRFISFKALIMPEELSKIKLYTNSVESQFSQKYSPPLRPVNLDPGYLSLSKIILATTKDYSHRLYLGDGIYGEVTLKYYRHTFVPWEWTYPDYKTKQYLDFFENLRAIYKDQLCSLIPKQIIQ